MQKVFIQFKSGRSLEKAGQIDEYVLRVSPTLYYAFNQSEIEYVEVEEIKE